jgi:hypothetical protein
VHYLSNECSMGLSIFQNSLKPFAACKLSHLYFNDFCDSSQRCRAETEGSIARDWYDYPYARPIRLPIPIFDQSFAMLFPFNHESTDDCWTNGWK